MKLSEGYFTDQGRMGRLEYIKRLMVVFGAIIVLAGMALGFEEYNELIYVGSLIALFLVPRVMLIFLYIRRLHDLNLSGWLILPLAIFMLDLLLLMPILTIWPGTKGPNNYGPPPTT